MSHRDQGFTPDEIKELVDEVQARLSARGIVGVIRIAGGAAMALRFPCDRRVRATRDIDASYEPRSEVDEVIAAVTAERRLEAGWFSANAGPWIRVREAGDAEQGFGVAVATPAELVAMKLAAGREHDLVDLGILADHLGADASELVDMAYEVYGQDAVELPDGRESYLHLAQAAIDRHNRRGSAAN